MRARDLMALPLWKLLLSPRTWMPSDWRANLSRSYASAWRCGRRAVSTPRHTSLRLYGTHRPPIAIRCVRSSSRLPRAPRPRLLPRLASRALQRASPPQRCINTNPLKARLLRTHRVHFIRVVGGEFVCGGGAGLAVACREGHGAVGMRARTPCGPCVAAGHRRLPLAAALQQPAAAPQLGCH